jgi:hypothetical protein
MEIALWTQTRLLFLTWPNNSFFDTWKNRFQTQGIWLESYSRELVQEPCVVYVLLAPAQSHSYIGSTECTLARRHCSRIRKIRQLVNLKFIECEVAIRFWGSNHSFSNYIPIILQITSSPQSALVQEACWQQKFQPSLCMPWILQHFKPGTKFKIPTLRVGKKLFKRFRHCQSGDSIIAADQKHQIAWEQLFQLGGCHLNRHRIVCNLRRSKVQVLHLYFLFRMTSHMTEPPKSRAHKALCKIFNARGLTIPQPVRPFIVPFLDHPEFKKNLRAFIKTWIQDHHDLWLPLHWPSTTIIEGSQKTIADLLHNWRPALNAWRFAPPTTCSCSSILTAFPDMPSDGNHIAGPFQSANLPQEVAFLASACTKDGCYRSKIHYFEVALLQIKKWYPLAFSGSQKASLEYDFIQFLESQWPLHLAAIKNGNKFTSALINKVKSLFPGCIFHNEDHKNQLLCIYCPLRYFAMITKTFGDDQVFTTLEITPAVLRQSLPLQISKRLLKKYHWGFNLSGSLAQGYILPKGKKQYTSARPIVASNNTICAKLFSALAKVLSNIMPIVYPHTYGNRSMNQILKDLHQHISQGGVLSSEFNDDLKGFFTSVPKEKIMTAISHIICSYVGLDKIRREYKSICFTVPHKITSKCRLIRGKSFTKSTTNKVIYLADIFEISQLALSFSQFVCMNTCYQQTRGAIIGGHASPILCAAAVAFQEHLWQRAYDVCLSSSQFLCIRYVDNRITIPCESIRNQPAVQRFLHPLFYVSPVELESCGNNILLGYSIHKDKVLYEVPTNSFCYRSARSAGSKKIVLSGLQARLHLLHRGTFPKKHCPALVSQILGMYQLQGFHMSLLQRIADRVAIRYH